MKSYIALVPIALLILSGTGIVSQTFAETILTLNNINKTLDINTAIDKIFAILNFDEKLILLFIKF